MITLTRLNGTQYVLNAELIRTVEANPDTIITLTTGEKMIVKESMQVVVIKSIEYGQRLRKLLPPS